MRFYIQTFLKDLRIASSYRLQFVFSIFSIFLSLFFIFIFSSLFEGTDNLLMDKYGGSYFHFLFFGFITAEITFLFLNTMPTKVREYQMTGIFEELIMCGKREIEVIFSSLLYPAIFQIFRLFCYLFALKISGINLLFLENLGFETILAFILFAVSLIGISLISTAVTITYKSPSIINRLYLSATSILSGVAFPVELLPKYLIFIGEIFPTTQFLKILRNDSLNNSEEIFLSIESLYLMAIFSLILLVFGIFSLKKSISIAKQNGTLLLY